MHVTLHRTTTLANVTSQNLVNTLKKKFNNVFFPELSAAVADFSNAIKEKDVNKAFEAFTAIKNMSDKNSTHLHIFKVKIVATRNDYIDKVVVLTHIHSISFTFDEVTETLELEPRSSQEVRCNSSMEWVSIACHGFNNSFTASMSYTTASNNLRKSLGFRTPPPQSSNRSPTPRPRRYLTPQPQDPRVRYSATPISPIPPNTTLRDLWNELCNPYFIDFDANLPQIVNLAVRVRESENSPKLEIGCKVVPTSDVASGTKCEVTLTLSGYSGNPKFIFNNPTDNLQKLMMVISTLAKPDLKNLMLEFLKNNARELYQEGVKHSKNDGSDISTKAVANLTSGTLVTVIGNHITLVLFKREGSDTSFNCEMLANPVLTRKLTPVQLVDNVGHENSQSFLLHAGLTSTFIKTAFEETLKVFESIFTYNRDYSWDRAPEDITWLICYVTVEYAQQILTPQVPE